MKKVKLEPLTETEQKIADLIYNEVSYMYCDNCRYNMEYLKKKLKKSDRVAKIAIESTTAGVLARLKLKTL